MTIPSEQLGWSNESKLLRDILKKLERLGIIISSGSSQLTSDELAAIQGANSPDAGNPFATMDDISDCCVVVSQTEPTNPSDGLLWYKPDLCETTTTTTRIPCDYEGVLTVGYSADPEGYGFYHGVLGSINPNDVNVGAIFWDAGVNNNIQVHLIDCFDSVTLFIDETQYELIWVTTYMGYNVHMIINILSNPFPAEGETCNIRICYGTPCTTTTTTPQPQ